MEELHQQWKQFVQLPFPPSAHTTDLPLEMLDATIAGCISTFITTGTLKQENILKLEESIKTLESEFEKIPQDAQEYFGQLLEMGSTILKNKMFS